MKTKIIILVDNKTRDLGGSIHLANHLGKKNGFQVFLLSTYRKFEIFLIKPDILIVPNIMNNYDNLIQECRKLNIRIVVSDTEGAKIGIYGNDEFLDNNLIKRKISKVDLYLSWGEKIKKLEKKIKKTDFNKLYPAGSYRFDLISKNKFKYKLYKNKPITLMTTYPIPNPRYQNVKEEKETALKNFYFNKKNLDIKCKIYLRLFNSFVNFCDKIFLNLKNQNFIIRVHPFENYNFYKERYSKFKNVTVDYQSNIHELIYNSKYVLSYGCQTSVECFAAKNYSLSLNFLDEAKKKASPKSMRCFSKEVNSYEELIKIIEKNKIIKIKKNKYINKTIKHFFYKFDFSAAERTAKVITNNFKNSKSDTHNFSDYKKLVYKICFEKLKGNLKLLLFKTIKIKRFYDIKNYLVKPSSKLFTSIEVKKFIQNYKGGKISVNKAKIEDYVIKDLGVGTALEIK